MMSLQKFRIIRVSQLFCAGLACLGLQHEACWATSVEVRQCSSIPPPKLDDKGYSDSPTARLYRALADETVDPICVGQEFPSYFGGDSIDVLLGILKSDQSSSLRARAALALGGVSENPGTIIGVLAHDLALERDERVFLARLESLAILLESAFASGVETGEGTRLPALMAELERASRSTIAAAIDYRDGERASESVGSVLRILNHMLVNTQRKTGVHDRLLSVAAHVVLPKETQAPSRDVWRARLLGDLQSALEADLENGKPRTREALLDSVSRLIGTGEVEVRLAAYGMLALLVDASVEGRGADALQAILVRTLNERDARLRAMAVKVLGRLAATRRDLRALLLGPLADSDEQVRREAAEALASGGAVPDAALPSLHAMAERLEQGSPSAIRALSFHRTPETLKFLAQLIVAPDGPTPLDPPHSNNETQQIVMDREAAAVHALQQFGEAAIVPLAAMADRATSPHSQRKLYLALNKLEWLRSGTDKSSELESALAPALDGKDESARQFALSLLARLRPYAGTRFSVERSEKLARRYLHGRVALRSDLQFHQSNSGYLWASDPDPAWLVAPEVATAIVAGNSGNSIAAREIVNWFCAKRRDRPIGWEISRSLISIGSVATVPVLAALRNEKLKHCRFDLLNALTRIDTGNDIDASVAMVKTLPKVDREARRAILAGLARSAPPLPSSSLAILAARERVKDPVQSLLARWIVDGRPKGRTPPYHLEAARISGDEDRYMREMREGWAREAVDDPDPYVRLEAVGDAGDLGVYGRDTVAVLVRVMQEDESIMVREAAAEALGRIGGHEALSALRTAQQSGPPKVATRAERAVERVLKSGM